MTDAAPGTCPLCGKPTDDKVRPFCSKRCADVDLKRWLGGDYVLPGTEPADPDDIEPADMDRLLQAMNPKPDDGGWPH